MLLTLSPLRSKRGTRQAQRDAGGSHTQNLLNNMHNIYCNSKQTRMRWPSHPRPQTKHRRVETETVHNRFDAAGKTQLNIENHRPAGGNNTWIAKLDCFQREQAAKRSATVPATSLGQQAQRRPKPCRRSSALDEASRRLDASPGSTRTKDKVDKGRVVTGSRDRRNSSPQRHAERGA